MSNKTFWRALRLGLAGIGVKTQDAEKLQENLEEHMDSAEPDDTMDKAMSDRFKAMDEFMKKANDRWAAEDAAEAEAKKKAEDAAAEEEEKKRKEKSESGAEEEEPVGDTVLEAEDPGKTINLGKTWVGSITGDAAATENVLPAIIARAEILAPGIAKPTADSLRGTKGKALATFMRSALKEHMTRDADAVNTFLLNRKVDDLAGHALMGVFNGAAQLARSRNNQKARVTTVTRRTGDFSVSKSVADIQAANDKFWAERSK